MWAFTHRSCAHLQILNARICCLRSLCALSSEYFVFSHFRTDFSSDGIMGITKYAGILCLSEEGRNTIHHNKSSYAVVRPRCVLAAFSTCML